MNFNLVNEEIRILSTKIDSINVVNTINAIENDSEKQFGLNILEPEFFEENGDIYATLPIEYEVIISKSDDCLKLQMKASTIFKGVNTEKERFEQLVLINGAAAALGVARGKIESISASILPEGKITIPFVNIYDYYKDK